MRSICKSISNLETNSIARERCWGLAGFGVVEMTKTGEKAVFWRFLVKKFKKVEKSA